MNTDSIAKVEITEGGDLLVYLGSGGKPLYQYIYRSAAGVHWDQERKAFRFAAQRDGQYVKWFQHVVAVVEDEMNLHLRLDPETTWKNILEEDRNAIRRAAI